MSFVSDAGSRRSSAFCATIGVPLAKSRSRYALAAMPGATTGAGVAEGAGAAAAGSKAATANADAANRRTGSMKATRKKSVIIAPARVAFTLGSVGVDRQHGDDMRVAAVDHRGHRAPAAHERHVGERVLSLAGCRGQRAQLRDA